MITEPEPAKPANEVIADFGAGLNVPQPSPSRSASASAPFRDAIELGLSRGRKPHEDVLTMAVFLPLVNLEMLTEQRVPTVINRDDLRMMCIM